MRPLVACSITASTLTLGLSVGAEVAGACSCAPVPGATPADRAKERMSSAGAAVVGRLIEVRPVGSRRILGPADFRYRIGQVYKGKRRLRRGRIVTVRAGRATVACGLPDEVGRRYGLLLYQRKRRPRWRSGLCSLMSARDMRLGAGTSSATPGDKGTLPPAPGAAGASAPRARQARSAALESLTTAIGAERSLEFGGKRSTVLLLANPALWAQRLRSAVRSGVGFNEVSDPGVSGPTSSAGEVPRTPTG